MSSLTEQIVKRLKELRDQMRYYGLIMGGALIGIELLTYMQRNNLSIGAGLFLFALKIGVLFYVSSFIVKKIKPEFFKAGMTYMQSFSIVMRLFLYGSLLLGLFIYVLNKWIDPDYLSVLLKNTIETIRGYIENLNLTDTQLEMFEDRIEELEESPLPTPLQAMWGQMWSYMIWGVFIGAFVSIFTRDKDINPFQKATSENED